MPFQSGQPRPSRLNPTSGVLDNLCGSPVELLHFPQIISMDHHLGLLTGKILKN